MKKWVIERLRPFAYVGIGSDGQYVDNVGSEKDSAFFAVPENLQANEVADTILNLYPFMIPRPSLGFAKQSKNDGTEFFRFLDVNKSDTVTVFYEWAGKTLFSANQAHFNLLGGQ